MLTSIWWLLTSILSTIWSLVWLLLGGWVSAALQVLLVVYIFYALRYGWRQAPVELGRRGLWLARAGWSWVLSRPVPDYRAAGPAGMRTAGGRRAARAPSSRKRRRWIRIDPSTALTLAAVAGILLLALAH